MIRPATSVISDAVSSGAPIAAPIDAPDTASVQRRFMANVASNAAYIGAQTVANLWMTPFLIGRMGVAAFGVIPLVHMVTAYLSVVTAALDSAVSRFLAIDLGRHDEQAANRTFNTALFGILAVTAGLSPLVVVIAVVFPTLFTVPAGWERDSSWLFALSAAAFFVTVIGEIFAVSPFVYSRFVWRNVVCLVGLAVRFGLIAALFLLLPARLWYAGAALLAGAVVCMGGYARLWRRLTPELHIRLSAFDLSRLHDLLSMSGWLVVNMAGAMLLQGTGLIVVNAYFGAAMTGSYAAVAQLALLIEYLAEAAAVVVRPVILAKYAHNDVAGVRSVASQAVRLLGLGLALPVGLLCGFGEPLLTLWLGSSFAHLSGLLVVLAAHLGLNLSVRPLLHVQNAYDKVKWPGIVTLISGVAALGLAVVLAHWGLWGYLGVAMAGALAWTVKNALYMPIYTAKIMGLRWWSYMPNMAPGIAGTLFVGGAAYALAQVGGADGWFALAALAAIVALVYAGFVWRVMLAPEDRRLIWNLAIRGMRSGALP